MLPLLETLLSDANSRSKEAGSVYQWQPQYQ
jgi:hypothetical protein